MVKDNETHREPLHLGQGADVLTIDADGDLTLSGAYDPSGGLIELRKVDKHTAAHLVRRIMAETGLTLVDVAAEPTQLDGEQITGAPV